MKKLDVLLLCVLSFSTLQSCDGPDDEFNPDVAFFTLTYRNTGNSCNPTNLNFTFQITRVSDGLQQTETVAQGQTLTGSRLGFDDGNTLNVKVFASSSENPISEANIEFHYGSYTEEQLRSENNQLQISYCHTENTGNITWVFAV